MLYRVEISTSVRLWLRVGVLVSLPVMAAWVNGRPRHCSANKRLQKQQQPCPRFSELESVFVFV